MKIEIKHGEDFLKVDFGSGVVFTSESAVDTIKELLVMVRNEAVGPPPLTLQMDKEAVKQLSDAVDRIKPVTTDRDSFGIRERIPNNIVDVKDLDVKQAVTENALVRCPKCGQAHALVVKDSNRLFLMRKNFDNNEFEIIADTEAGNDNGEALNAMMCHNGEYLEYFKMLQDASVIDSSDFAVNNDTEIFCPVCHQSNTFMNWKDAWENPLHFFETEHICQVCGGEISCSVSKEGSDNGVCNDCKTEVCNGKPNISE